MCPLAKFFFGWYDKTNMLLLIIIHNITIRNHLFRMYAKFTNIRLCITGQEMLDFWTVLRTY